MGCKKLKFVDIKEIFQNKGEKKIYFNFEIEHTHITVKNLFNCSPKKGSKRSNSFQFISLALKSVFCFIQISLRKVFIFVSINQIGGQKAEQLHYPLFQIPIYSI